MKFSDMPYARPDLDEEKARLVQLTRRLRNAPDYATAREAFLERDQADRHLSTQRTLAHIRNTMDTRDPYYDREMKFWHAALPELQAYTQEWTRALLGSPYRRQLEEEFGSISFTNAELQMKAFSPELIPELQQENELAADYEKLLATAQVPFEGGRYTLSQMSLFKNDPDDTRRLAAWKAEGQWYKDHQADLDGLYDQLVHLRDSMGKKLGYEGYTTLGYCRMNRNCYTKEDVEHFREAVREYLVPVAADIYKVQAKRLGREYPMNFADNQLEFRSGNPKPLGTPEEILAQGMKFYGERSPQTREFFQTMLDGELLDVLSREGKRSGGYCTGIPDYGVPFVFANFSGVQHDVEVVTHEAGHAFAYYLNRDRVPASTCWPSMESCEVHSMSMEFMAWPWAEGFFGEDTRKFKYSHLAKAVTFIPYGAMVDHFQHVMYEQPDLTPAQRHGVWKDLMGVYMPWMRLDGEIPFYGEGEHWQRQHHIYSNPFYYIDYALAQTVSLEFWALLQQDPDRAWETYMAYTRQGGSETFVKLLEQAGLESPFARTTLEQVSRQAGLWLNHYDLSGIL